MASSKNQKYEDASKKYDTATEQYTGQKGYENSLAAAKNGSGLADEQIRKGNAQGLNTAARANAAGQSQGLGNTNAANANATGQSQSQNSLVNSEAQKYAGQQAANAAAGAQSQATTAARAAGMNKAQAAMMGSQQNANAYQNAFGNAYSQQMGQANNAFENQANRANANMNNMTQLNAQQMSNATNVYGQNQAQQQNSMTAANNAGVSAAGTKMGAAQTEGQAEYDRTWGNWGNGLGIGGSVLKAFSDEDLKHYKECSKKVAIRSPKSIQKLKFVQKEN
jgi:hypothetical protein